MKLYNELAPYYFSIENNHRIIEEDIAFIKSYIGGNNAPTLLDLGCGTGEHVTLLSSSGFKCTGLDNSEAMLTIARERSPAHISFVKSDITDFDFYNEFDIIISLFGSFDYLLENNQVDKALWNTWRALKSTGICIFEIWNTAPIKKIREKNLSHVSTTRLNDMIIERERGFKLLNHPGKDMVEVFYNYTVTNTHDSSLLKDKHIMRSYNNNEFKQFLNENGFKMRDIFANFNKAPYNSISNKMIVVFEKAL